MRWPEKERASRFACACGHSTRTTAKRFCDTLPVQTEDHHDEPRILHSTVGVGAACISESVARDSGGAARVPAARALVRSGGGGVAIGRGAETALRAARCR